MLAIRSVHLFDGERSRPGRPTVIVEGAMIELSERDMHTIVDGVVGDDFVVAAAQVLHERAPGCDYAQRVGRLHPAHRPQPGFESAVIGFHPVIGVPLADMARGGYQLVDHAGGPEPGPW